MRELTMMLRTVGFELLQKVVGLCSKSITLTWLQYAKGILTHILMSAALNVYIARQLRRVIQKSYCDFSGFHGNEKRKRKKNAEKNKNIGQRCNNTTHRLCEQGY